MSEECSNAANVIAYALADAQNLSADGTSRSDIRFAIQPMHRVIAEHIAAALADAGIINSPKPRKQAA